MTKRTVYKEMIMTDWLGEWRIVEVVAESDASVWVKSRFDGNPVRKNKKTTDHQFHELDDEGVADVRKRLVSKMDAAKKKAAHATGQLASFDMKMTSLGFSKAKEEALRLARMQQNG